MMQYSLHSFEFLCLGSGADLGFSRGGGGGFSKNFRKF